MKKSVSLTATALVRAVAIAAVAYFVLVERGGLPDTAVILRVDMDALKRSALFKQIIEDTGLDAGLTALAEKCGYDLLGPVAELFLFVRPEEKFNSVAVVARGQLDPDATMNCMRMRLEENQVVLEETQLEGFRALTSETISSRVAFVGSRGMVLGEEPVVVDILKRVRGQIPQLDRKSHLATLYERMRPRRDIVLAAELPENWHRGAHDLLEPEQAYALMPSLMGLHEAGLGLSVRDGLSLGGVLVFNEEKDASKAASVAETTLENMKKNVFLSLTPVGPALSGVSIESVAAEMRFGLTLTEAQIQELLRVAKAFGDDADQTR